MASFIRHQRPHRNLALFVPWLCLCFCWAPSFVGSHTKIARRNFGPSRATADPAVLDLAKQVRDVQSSGPSGNVQWSLYVKTFSDLKDADGSAILAPGKYDAGFLEDFVSNFKDGYRLSSVAAAVAEGAQLEASGIFKKALDAHLRKQSERTVTAMSDTVAGDFLKLCGELCLKDTAGDLPKSKGPGSKAPVSSSSTEVASKVSDIQNSGPSGAKQWALYLQNFAEATSPSSSPADYDDDFLKDFLDNFNDGYRLSSTSAAVAECAQLESSGVFAKAMETFLRNKGNDASISSVTDEIASEFLKRCGQVGFEHLDEVPPPLPPLPPLEPVAGKPPSKAPERDGTIKAKPQTTDVSKPASKKAPAPAKPQTTDVSKPPSKKAPAPAPAPAPGLALSKHSAETLDPQALDAKVRLNEWMHSRLKRKPTLEDMTFAFRIVEADGRQQYSADLEFLNKKLAPNGAVTFTGTPQESKKDAIDSAAHEALLALNS